MSIILEALKKASLSRNTQKYAATTIEKQEKKNDTGKNDMLDGSGFSMSTTMLMAVGTIIAVGVVAYGVIVEGIIVGILKAYAVGILDDTVVVHARAVVGVLPVDTLRKALDNAVLDCYAR